MKAPIIVLEGLDACGKSTQTELLIQHLKENELKVGFVRFPGYEKTAAGRRIAAYLRGEFGNLDDFDPKMIAALYASDRLVQVEEIEKLRSENDVVIFDRGVSSNLIYTPARAKRKSEIMDLIAFVEQLEYTLCGFPRESLVLFLDASEESRKKIHAEKNRLPDIHEADEEYLKRVREIALTRCEDKKDLRWHKLSIDRGGELRRREDIAKEILRIVLERLQKKDVRQIAMF